MAEQNNETGKKVLSLTGRTAPKTDAKGGAEMVRQSFSHGRSKTVAVEVKKKRAGGEGGPAPSSPGAAPARPGGFKPSMGGGPRNSGAPKRSGPPELTEGEREARARALRSMGDAPVRASGLSIAELNRPAPAAPAPEAPRPAPRATDAETLRRQEMDELRRIKEQERQAATMAELKRQEEENAKKRAEAEKKNTDDRRKLGERAGEAVATKFADRFAAPSAPGGSSDDDNRRRGGGPVRRGPGGAGAYRPPLRRAGPAPAPVADRSGGRVDVGQALSDGDNVRTRSQAAMRRRAERDRRQFQQQSAEKILRDVVIPEVITVQELANRMAERSADVIKSLMKMGVMATINQNIDADTAELIVSEFGHRLKRVTEADVLEGLTGETDVAGDLMTRPPIVTIMGHVDHGKTSLLDAIRKTDVARGEAGGITQHIGAYQVMLQNGGKVTFIDTPGHAAFSEMRARGANLTDIVVLVVAADDGIKPQTIEAIRHARAANVPIIVAINKCDLPGANPQKVRTELLQHEIVVEQMGGETLDVEVSAKTGMGLEKLLETILLQSEVLELTANPDRMAQGVVVESKMEKGRGAVATVLMLKGTLRVGEIFVAGAEWGRVRALINDKGEPVTEAGPAMPVEVLGVQGTPGAGEEFVVVESEARAREVADFRARKKRELTTTATSRGTLDQMLAQIKDSDVKELAVVIKGDVHGSVEAIATALSGLADAENTVRVRVLHSAVGPITESDITLANASRALLIGFNVRANPQARELAKREGLEIRYYSIIYEVIDDVRAALTTLLAPTLRENFLGHAQIREVFDITKTGKVAGCMVTDGLVKRGAGVRLLREDVVIHTGTLKTLRRFKDEVKEVREGYECGMAFENYEDIRTGDTIEAYEIEEIARALA